MDGNGGEPTSTSRRAQRRSRTAALQSRADIKRSAPAALKHYLLTIAAPAGRVNFHGYLMADDKRHIEAAAGRMMKTLEDNHLAYLPMILVTPLNDSGVEAVRKIACKQNGDIKGLIAQATDFHFSAWLMPDGDPEDAQLMELH
jgi:hypothetical protein